MVYEDTVPVSFREFSGKFRKIAYFGSVPSIFISCRFDYAKLREVVANVGDDVTAGKNFIRVVYKDIN